MSYKIWDWRMELEENCLMRNNYSGLRIWEEKEIDSRKDLIITAETICDLVKFLFLKARSPCTDTSLQLSSLLIYRGVHSQHCRPPHCAALKMLRTLSYVSLGSDSQMVHPLGLALHAFKHPLNLWRELSSLPHEISPHISSLLTWLLVLQSVLRYGLLTNISYYNKVNGFIRYLTGIINMSDAEKEFKY